MKEFWLGLDHIYHLTNAGTQYMLKVELMGADGVYKEAYYDSFKLLDDVDYTLDLGSFVTADSTSGDSFGYHSGKKFSALDKDSDERNSSCAVSNEGPNW